MNSAHLKYYFIIFKSRYMQDPLESILNRLTILESTLRVLGEKLDTLISEFFDNDDDAEFQEESSGSSEGESTQACEEDW